MNVYIHMIWKRWISYAGFKKWKRFNEYDMRRSNPDLDGWVYKDNEGNETLALFKNKEPTNINDAFYPANRGYIYEHPNELLAYYIDHLYVK